MLGGRKPSPVKNQFSRPGVSLDRNSREWKTVSPLRWDIGDNVPDFGLIRDIEILSNTFPQQKQETILVRATFSSGDTAVFSPSNQMMVFTEGIPRWGKSVEEYLTQNGL